MEENNGQDSKGLLIIGGVMVAVLALLVGGYFFMQNRQANNQEINNITEEVSPEVVEKKQEATQAGVEIKDFAFDPASLTVKKGTMVTWTNRDTIGHTATADDGVSFDTGLLGQNETGSMVFDTVGIFAYHCTPHPAMKATIVVTE